MPTARRIATVAAALTMAAGAALSGASSASADTGTPPSFVNNQCSDYSPTAHGWNIGVCVVTDESGLHHGWLQMWGTPGPNQTDVRYHSVFRADCPSGSYNVDVNTGLTPSSGTNAWYFSGQGDWTPGCKFTETAYFTESGVTQYSKSVSWSSPS